MNFISNYFTAFKLLLFTIVTFVGCQTEASYEAKETIQDNATDSFETIDSTNSSDTIQNNDVVFLSSSSLSSLSSSVKRELIKGTLTDTRDGKVYKTIEIGKQTWMAENLKVFSNDNGITRYASSFCYDHNKLNCDVYGRLYEWYTALYGEVHSNKNPSGVKGVCPDAWHLPSVNEWIELADFIAEDSGFNKKGNIGSRRFRF